MSTAPRVLVVDDNAINLALMTYLLDACGFETAAAGNGEEALACLADWPDAAAVLCDIQMPVMDGYDATRAIRALSGDKANTPIIAMTANVMAAERQRCFDAGMDGFIPKPFKKEDMLGEIGRVVG